MLAKKILFFYKIIEEAMTRSDILQGQALYNRVKQKFLFHFWSTDRQKRQTGRKDRETEKTDIKDRQTDRKDRQKRQTDTKDG